VVPADSLAGFSDHGLAAVVVLGLAALAGVLFLGARALQADRPVLEVNLAHRKIPRVPGCQRNRKDCCGGRDQTVRLCERNSRGRVVASPSAGQLAVIAVDLDHPETIEEPVGSRRFLGPEPAMDFLDVDRGRARDARLAAQRPQPLYRARPAAEYVD
jgi:hypothetical protein